MTTPDFSVPEDVWVLVTDRLSVADMNALMSVNRELESALRKNPQAWRQHLTSCNDEQLEHVASVVPALAPAAERLRGLRAMTTVAGEALYGFSGDGGPAYLAMLRTPHGVAVGADGTVYVADTFNHRIRCVTADGTITTLAGTGRPGFGGDGGPAHLATLYTPHGVAVGADGTVYVTERLSHRVRCISADGTITTLAGTGRPGFGGDGGPAHLATLYTPHGVAVGADGTVYVTDAFNHNLRRITMDGTITTLAGTGQQGYGGDDGPAHLATLRSPYGVAVGADGTVYVADTFNHRIRCISGNGTITTLAGTGRPGFGGDGGPAHLATLHAPHGVAVGADGTVYVTDTLNYRIRCISGNGTITTLAGTGRSGFSGDAGPARQAALFAPNALAVGKDYFLYTCESNRLRRFGVPH
ncbi:hypothetical protein ABZS92_40345 [Streptomyces sp. NPDC005444]|uniref:NHL domain-containing protein n=1 Tax=unclassified Streptomyces TaxID=2593676 RepID=UPI0033B0DB78